MVVLMIDNNYRLMTTLLEYELIDANIEYQYQYYLDECEYDRPCLVVDGVPLDMARAMKWIKEHKV